MELSPRLIIEYILYTALTVAIVYFLFKWIKRFLNSSESVGNWIHVFNEFQYSPEEFYKSVEEMINQYKMPHLYISRRTFQEGSLGSPNRLYLEVERKDHIFHICAAPFGTNFFFSWWLRKKNPSILLKMVSKIPVIGPALNERGQFKAYYHWDTDTLFRKTIHDCILKAIDQITAAKGIKGLSEAQRKPTTKEPFLTTA